MVKLDATKPITGEPAPSTQLELELNAEKKVFNDDGDADDAGSDSDGEGAAKKKGPSQKEMILSNPLYLLFHKDAQFKKKLYTKEDKFPNEYMDKTYFGGYVTPIHVPHVHKILGILSLLSFFYRYAYIYNVQGNLGFDGSTFDWATMAVHTLLAFSSIVFRVPRKRIETKPMVIYEEYRQHAMVFTFRCFAVFAVNQLWKVYFPDEVYPPQCVIPLVVLLHHLLVDRITANHGSGQTAVRANSAKLKTSKFYKRVGYLYSFYQFLSLASHLSPSARVGDMAYNSIIAIQSSAFMMTLYRKRIIRGRTHMVVYSACLVLSAWHIVHVLPWIRTLLCMTTFGLRLNIPREYSSAADKYMLWTGFLLLNAYLASEGLLQNVSIF
jgi:hypothetical protein